MPEPPTSGRLREALAARLGVDARALAALRAALGALLVVDLLLRARDLTAHYTDAGVLPRSLLAAEYGALRDGSLHAVSGEPWVVALLFLLAGVAALAVLVGYRTRLSLFVSWLLLVSLHARNPLVLNAGDSLLRRLLFWGLFLPLGGRWSLDALREAPARGRVVSVASAALLGQVVVVYAVNAVVKFRGDVWSSGRAMLYVFSLDRLTVRFGDFLAGFPDLLVPLGHLWLVLLVASPLLLLLTGWPRALLAGAFAAMHFGMFLTMRIGVFPLVSMAALLAFLPPDIWTRVERALVARGIRERLVGAGRRLSFPAGPTLPGRVRPAAGRAASALVVVLVALLVVWNAAALGYVDAGDTGPVDPAEHRWDMFAPSPPTTDGWYVVNGTLESGGHVDPLQRAPVEWGRPAEPASRYPTQRWFMYLYDVQQPSGEAFRPALGDYLCERWNATHADDLVAVNATVVEQPTRLDGPDPLRRRHLFTHECE